MPTRMNILSNNAVRDAFLQGVVTLDESLTNITAGQAYQTLRNAGVPIQMAGINQRLSYYDLLVLWHVAAMELSLAVGNAAHRGPIFLPWHRHYMIQLEQWLQIVTGNADFGLPYWDWAADGELPAWQQWQTPLWSAAGLGESRNQVQSGPLGRLRVRLEQDVFTGVVWSVEPRPLERDAGRSGASTLPTLNDVERAMDEPLYDFPDWSANVPGGHRNRLEGWINGPQLHNRIHVWVGGDMGPGTSPNDPVFFLNHCNVDRIWEAWMARQGRVYAPAAGVGPAGHRLDSAMFTLLGGSRTPGQVLDASPWYDYDSLTVS